MSLCYFRLFRLRRYLVTGVSKTIHIFVND